MNPLFLTFMFIFIAMWTCSNFGTKSQSQVQSTEVRTIIVGEAASDGLDLQALPAIVKDAKTAEELEVALNQPNGVNNLDLNDDEVVDFIKVTEFSDTDKYGFSLTTEPVAGEEQEIATIEVSEEGDNANVTVEGNQQVYGNNASYRSSFPIGSFLLMSYLLSPRPFYASPYTYGAYPSYYRPYSTSDNTAYNNRTANARSTANATKANGTSLKSPNAGKTANSGIKKNLANPSSTQKQFQSRNTSKRVGSGGFGRSTGTRNFSGTSRGFGGFGK